MFIAWYDTSAYTTVSEATQTSGVAIQVNGKVDLLYSSGLKTNNVCC